MDYCYMDFGSFGIANAKEVPSFLWTCEAWNKNSRILSSVCFSTRETK